jgi:hypothetical protein
MKVCIFGCSDEVINLKTLSTTTYARQSWLLGFHGGAQE